MSLLNPYTIKKNVALMLPAWLCTAGFFMGVTFLSLWWGIGIFLILAILCTLMGNVLLKHAFTDLLEGKGLLLMDITSTGIIKLHIVNVVKSFLVGKASNGKVKDIFDREAVYQMAAPDRMGNAVPDNETGGLTIKLNEEEYHKARFVLGHFPVIIYNSQLQTVLTKDFFSAEEKAAFAEHTVLYLNRIMEELTNLMRDFGRYVVETLKPQTGGLGSKWIWIIIGIGLVIMAALFLPKIMEVMQGGVTNTVKDAVTGGGIQTPIN